MDRRVVLGWARVTERLSMWLVMVMVRMARMARMMGGDGRAPVVVWMNIAQPADGETAGGGWCCLPRPAIYGLVIPPLECE